MCCMAGGPCWIGWGSSLDWMGVPTGLHGLFNGKVLLLSAKEVALSSSRMVQFPRDLQPTCGTTAVVEPGCDTSLTNPLAYVVLEGETNDQHVR